MADVASSKREREDEAKLQSLGYTQELRRDWNLLQNFGVSFSIISIITGITTLFSYGLTNGGPAVMSIGWIVVSFFTFFVAFAMAEIVSAIPSAGGPYFWAATLSPPSVAPFAAWVTGWFNLLGQVAVTTGISFGLAGLISTTATVMNSSYEPTPGKVLGIYIAILISHVLVNILGVGVLRYLNNSSIILHSVGVSVLAIALLAKAPTHQSGSFVFQTFNDGTAVPNSDGLGWSVRASSAYVAILGLLMAQFTLTGFDASAHLSEETRNASLSAPIGVITSVGASSVFGFFIIMALLFSIQDYADVLASTYTQPVLSILVQVFGPSGAVALMTLIMVCVWHCGLFSLTSNSRMMFAFSRDSGLPQYFHFVDARFGCPSRAVGLAAVLAFLLALPSLGSTVAYSAATSIATIGLYISYAIPILLTLIYPSNFTRGPFNLRFASKPVAAIACLWTAFITVTFCLPNQDPVNSQTLNYTCVAVGIVGVWALGSWVLWARRWFVGPRAMVMAESAGDFRAKRGEGGDIMDDAEERKLAAV